MNLENTKVYTKDLDVIRKYAELCGKKVPCLPCYECIGIAMWAGSRFFDFFIAESLVDTGSDEKEITPEQINALYAEKFGDGNNGKQLHELSEFNVDGIATETQEEAEAFNHMHKSHECEVAQPEWKNGDECVYMTHNVVQQFIGADPKRDGYGYIQAPTYEVNFVELSKLSKPETEAERKERERLEAAYDLFVEWQRDEEFDLERLRGFEDFKRDSQTASDWLRVVDKTGYRKQKDGE